MNDITSPQPPESLLGNEAACEIFYDLVADLGAFRQKLEEAGVSRFIVEEALRHSLGDVITINTDVGLEQANKYPQYWKHLPPHWRAVDVYRIGMLFPTGDPSHRVDHARKKLLVPGVRTGGKSYRDDIREAHSTLGAWLIDNR